MPPIQTTIFKMTGAHLFQVSLELVKGLQFQTTLVQH